jgi:hypothetical protein
MIKKILSWFKFNRYIKVVHKDPMSFEMDQLMKKNEKPSNLVTKVDKKFNKSNK